MAGESTVDRASVARKIKTVQLALMIWWGARPDEAFKLQGPQGRFDFLSVETITKWRQKGLIPRDKYREMKTAWALDLNRTETKTKAHSIFIIPKMRSTPSWTAMARLVLGLREPEGKSKSACKRITEKVVKDWGALT